jgi:hypothetical protein
MLSKKVNPTTKLTELMKNNKQTKGKKQRE